MAAPYMHKTVKLKLPVKAPFRYLQRLVDQQAVWTGRKKCPHCGKMFAAGRGIKIHITRVHKDEHLKRID